MCGRTEYKEILKRVHIFRGHKIQIKGKKTESNTCRQIKIVYFKELAAQVSLANVNQKYVDL